MITSDTARYIAGLARIHLREDEIKRLTGNLEDILQYIAKLEKIDISGVEPTSHVLPLHDVFRKDEIKASLPQREALSIAVAQQNGSFKVPLVIE